MLRQEPVMTLTNFGHNKSRPETGCQQGFLRRSSGRGQTIYSVFTRKAGAPSGGKPPALYKAAVTGLYGRLYCETAPLPPGLYLYTRTLPSRYLQMKPVALR